MHVILTWAIFYIRKISPNNSLSVKTSFLLITKHFIIVYKRYEIIFQRDTITIISNNAGISNKECCTKNNMQQHAITMIINNGSSRNEYDNGKGQFSIVVHYVLEGAIS